MILISEFVSRGWMLVGVRISYLPFCFDCTTPDPRTLLPLDTHTAPTLHI